MSYAQIALHTFAVRATFQNNFIDIFVKETFAGSPMTPVPSQPLLGYYHQSLLYKANYRHS